MNKVFNINLGGYPFTIDEDAFEALNKYLQTIHRHFRNSEGYEEITDDIEARMAELFQESLQGRQIVMHKDVQNGISVMGTPEDFGAEPMAEETHYSEATDTTTETKKERRRKTKYKTGKRLFRNGEDEVLGGVCSGVAAYFGVEDPLWVRLGFVLLTISGGFSIPIYLLLWAIVPKAESASDRLAMRGEPVNASNIGKIVEEEIDYFSEKVSEWGEDFGSKKKARMEREIEEMMDLELDLDEMLQEMPLRKGFHC